MVTNYVFVDMDETLLHTDMFTGRVHVRPGAIEGLKGLYGLGEVHVLTAAPLKYAEIALTVTGLRKYVRNVYSMESDPIFDWTFDSPRVLIDDKPASAMHTARKLAAMGVPLLALEQHLVKVEPFVGVDNVAPLDAYVPAAHLKLLSQ